MQAVATPVPIRYPLPARDWRTWLLTIPLALIVIYAFIPTLDNGFVGWYDDDQNFRDNPYFRGLAQPRSSGPGVRFLLGVYQPLAWLLFEVQYVFWKLDPRGYHLTSLLLHATNAVVLYVLTVTLLVRCRADCLLESPWTCSLARDSRPPCSRCTRCELRPWPGPPASRICPAPCSRCWRFLPISAHSRWFLPAVGLARGLVRPVRGGPVVQCGGGEPAGGAVDPGRLPAAAIRGRPRAMVRGVGAESLVGEGPVCDREPCLHGCGHRGQAAITDLRSSITTPWRGIAQACYGIWFNILKTVLPLDLIAVYPLPREINWLAPPFLWSILATLAMSVGLFLLRRRWPGLLAAWLSYLVILAPNSGIIRISGQIAADRYSYMSTLGLVILAAAGFCRLWRMLSRWRPGAIGITAFGLGRWCV